MTDTAEAEAALTTLARFIESRSASSVAETAGDRDIELMAVERCTTHDIFCRSLEIGTVMSALMDRIDWPNETKLGCREILAAYAQQDLAWMAKVRRHKGMIN